MLGPLERQAGFLSAEDKRNHEEVTKWLRGLELERLAVSFLENGLDDLDVLEDLTYDDLDRAGVWDEEDRRKLLTAATHIHDFKRPEGGVEEEDPDDGVPFQLHSFDSSSVYNLQDELFGNMATRAGEFSHRGFLSKQGGGNKGWKRRWVVFAHNQLKYYKAFQDREPAGVIDLDEIVSVGHNEAEARRDPRYAHCFDVATSREGRVFVFCGDSPDSARGWVDFLLRMVAGGGGPAGPQTGTLPPGSAPLRHSSGFMAETSFSLDMRRASSVIPGGFDDPPDKHGWLKKMGNNMAKDWKRRYVALKGARLFYYRSHEDYVGKEPINFVDMLTTTVKPSVAGGRYRFELVTLHRSFWFQADTQAELMDWVTALQSAIAAALTTVQSQKSQSQQRADGSQSGNGARRGEAPRLKLVPGAQVLEALRESEANRLCADCGMADPDWASINLGILVCIECSGIHRGLGVHVSKVRSLPLDEWTPSLVGLMKALGNERANRVWEADVPASVRRLTPRDDVEVKRTYITAKYVQRSYVVRDLDRESRDRNLFESVKSDDVAETARLVASGANIRYIDIQTGQPLLHAALQAGQATQIEFLLQNGADPLIVDSDGTKLDDVSELSPSC